MALDDYKDTVNRSVWENPNGSKLLTVTGLLKTGSYEIKKQENDDGTIVLELTEIED